MSSRVRPILTVTTNPALDVSVTVDELVPDDKLRATDSRREPGGGGVNVARVLARFGVDTRAVVAVGGAVGAELVDLVESEGIEVTQHRLGGVTRESISITASTPAQQYRIVTPGTEVDDPAALTARVVSAAADVDWVVLSGSLAPGLPADYLQQLTHALVDRRVVIDCSGAALASSLRGSCFLAKPSLNELASVVGRRPTTMDEIDSAAREVLDLGSVEHLVVSVGARGAVLVSRDAPSRWLRPPEVQLVSSVGSGDSMVAGMVASLAAGGDVLSAVRRGVAAGTATATTPGSALCDAEVTSGIERSVQVTEVERG